VIPTASVAESRRHWLVQSYLFISRKRLSGPGMLSKIEMLHEGAGLFTISYITARVSTIIEGDKKIQLSQKAYPAVSHHNQ
jgi:hypothetical protein